MACARCGGFLVNEDWEVSSTISVRSFSGNEVCELWVHRRFRDFRESSY